MESILKLKELISVHQNPDERDRRKIQFYQNETKRINALEKVKNHAGIKIIQSWLQEKVEAINDRLQNEREITELDRKILFDERELCQTHLSWYSPEESDKRLTQQIELEINYLKSQ